MAVTRADGHGHMALLVSEMAAISVAWRSPKKKMPTQSSEAAGLPADEEVCGTIWFGTPAGPLPQPPTKRLSVADVLRRSE